MERKQVGFDLRIDFKEKQRVSGRENQFRWPFPGGFPRERGRTINSHGGIEKNGKWKRGKRENLV